MKNNDNEKLNHKILNKSVFLVGIMGCGKSSIGSRFAKLWDIDFFDVDKLIEKEEGLSVSKIFGEKGEKYFRDKELEVINKLISDKPSIIATGGGAFINDDIRKLILDKAISVWLKADFNIVLERVSRKNTRPLLEKGNKEEILKELFEKRTPYYEKADITVESSNKSHKFTIDRLEESLIKYIENNK